MNILNREEAWEQVGVMVSGLRDYGYLREDREWAKRGFDDNSEVVTT